MNSILYKHLYNKAHNEETKNRQIYHCQISNNADILLNMVNSFILFFKHNPIRNKVYLLVRNEIHSIAILIALLELNYSPILIDYNTYDKKSKRKTTDSIYFKNGVIGFFDKEELDEEKLNIDIKKMKDRKVVNEPKQRTIGLLTSGSVSEPKLVYLTEEAIANNVKSSKFINYERRIYNPINISSISGLFTNVFFPIIGSNTRSTLSSDYHMHIMINYTDIYLNRDIQKIFEGTTRIEVGAIKRFFVFGESVTKDTLDFLHKIDVLDFQVVNVYGSTELAGLAYECEEKDMQEIFIYKYDIDNDSVTYSFDKIHFYKREKNNVHELSKEEIASINKDNCISFLPCGIKDNRITINNHNIGEAIINGYDTGDIFLIINNKLYALGRRQDLIMSTSLSYLDNLYTNKTNRKCTVIPHNNELYLAVRYPLDYNKVYTGNDHTTYFRRFINEEKKIRETVQETNTQIKDILFLPDEKFPISKSLNKSRRNEFDDQFKYYQTINYRLEHFDEVLNDFIKKVFMEKLHYIPEYEFDKDKNIVIPFDQIDEPKLVELINDLNIVAIERHEYERKYYIYYDDGYFFFVNRKYLYSEAKIDEYKALAKINLFIPRLLADNCQKYLKDLLSDSFKFPSYFYENVKIYAKLGVNENGEIMLIPYFQDKYVYDNILDAYRSDANKYIKKHYPNIHFKDCSFDAISIEFNADDTIRHYMENPIIIKRSGEIISDKLGKIIATALLHQDVFKEVRRIQINEDINKWKK